MESSMKTNMFVHLFSNSSVDHLQTRGCKLVFASFFACSVLFLLPLCIHVLCVGSQRWRKQRSNPTAEMISHSDIITFNMVGVELVAVSGMSLYCYGSFSDRLTLLIVGFYILSIIAPGQTLFHALTCVERYLAVVHPVTYMGLKQSGGVRIRNVSIGGVWMICFASLIVAQTVWAAFVLNLITMLLSSAVVCFCSLSVLHVLIHPGPREGVDPARQRAFHTILAITGVLLLRSFLILVYFILNVLSAISTSDDCFMTWSAAWLSLPSSLVLPLLFLHRAGKLPGCKQRTGTG
ncbi:uncharacterized protein LOC117809827 [Notolabrus celidotus]|uniref:uncharacterized protein LOC117809827 n=1 Tax=Notolabrus celidotus TaxID=1203425 RepID=UPI00148FF4B1|nr:uncharacterized protein LOC117809827 [Notolabrus celidotus]